MALWGHKQFDLTMSSCLSRAGSLLEALTFLLVRHCGHSGHAGNVCALAALIGLSKAAESASLASLFDPANSRRRFIF